MKGITLAIAAVVAVLCCAGGCKSSPTAGASASPAPTSSSPSRTPSPPAGPARTDLTITVRPVPGATPVVHTLTCDPTGGNLPGAPAACALLVHLPKPFAPTPPGIMCSDIVSGEQTATITGTLRGQPVDAKFNRLNSCQTARWMKIAPLLVS